jgi:hypothetical protein
MCEAKGKKSAMQIATLVLRSDTLFDVPTAGDAHMMGIRPETSQ